MKKKIFRVLIVLIVVLVAVFYLLVVPKVVSLITDYPRYTFEYVTEDTAMVSSYAIFDNRNPADYGYPNYQTVDYKSWKDDINLNGWYIPASKDSITKTLVISHGRTANRLKTMKYLQVIKEYGLDSMYHVFIPDHRNSGKSQEASTAMGYKFAEDIAGVLKMLKTNYGHQEFTLWGFSMGAMATATLINRPDTKAFLEEEDIQIDAMILASPVSNVEATVKLGSDNMGVPSFVFNICFNRFSSITDDYVDNMKFSYLLNNNKKPTLVLYGTADASTPAPMLEEEIKGLSHVEAHSFADAEHVQLYTQPQFRQHYGDLVNEFLRR